MPTASLLSIISQFSPFNRLLKSLLSLRTPAVPSIAAFHRHLAGQQHRSHSLLNQVSIDPTWKSHSWWCECLIWQRLYAGASWRNSETLKVKICNQLVEKSKKSALKLWQLSRLTSLAYNCPSQCQIQKCKNFLWTPQFVFQAQKFSKQSLIHVWLIARV